MSDKTIEVIEYKGKFYNIKRNRFEIREHYIDRANYIITHMSSNQNFEEIVRQSIIWLNQKVLGCEY
jgi:hypothetical protein